MSGCRILFPALIFLQFARIMVGAMATAVLATVGRPGSRSVGALFLGTRQDSCNAAVQLMRQNTRQIDSHVILFVEIMRHSRILNIKYAHAPSELRYTKIYRCFDHRYVA